MALQEGPQENAAKQHFFSEWRDQAGGNEGWKRWFNHAGESCVFPRGNGEDRLKCPVQSNVHQHDEWQEEKNGRDQEKECGNRRGIAGVQQFFVTNSENVHHNGDEDSVRQQRADGGELLAREAQKPAKVIQRGNENVLEEEACQQKQGRLRN